MDRVLLLYDGSLFAHFSDSSSLLLHSSSCRTLSFLSPSSSLFRFATMNATADVRAKVEEALRWKAVYVDQEQILRPKVEQEEEMEEEKKESERQESSSSSSPSRFFSHSSLSSPRFLFSSPYLHSSSSFSDLTWTSTDSYSRITIAQHGKIMRVEFPLELKRRRVRGRRNNEEQKEEENQWTGSIESVSTLYQLPPARYRYTYEMQSQIFDVAQCPQRWQPLLQIMINALQQRKHTQSDDSPLLPLPLPHPFPSVSSDPLLNQHPNYQHYQHQHQHHHLDVHTSNLLSLLPPPSFPTIPRTDSFLVSLPRVAYLSSFPSSYSSSLDFRSGSSGGRRKEEEEDDDDDDDEELDWSREDLGFSLLHSSSLALPQVKTSTFQALVNATVTSNVTGLSWRKGIGEEEEETEKRRGRGKGRKRFTNMPVTKSHGVRIEWTREATYWNHQEGNKEWRKRIMTKGGMNYDSSSSFNSSSLSSSSSSSTALSLVSPFPLTSSSSSSSFDEVQSQYAQESSTPSFAGISVLVHADDSWIEVEEQFARHYLHPIPKLNTITDSQASLESQQLQQPQSDFTCSSSPSRVLIYSCSSLPSLFNASGLNPYDASYPLSPLITRALQLGQHSIELKQQQQMIEEQARIKIRGEQHQYQPCSSISLLPPFSSSTSYSRHLPSSSSSSSSLSLPLSLSSHLHSRTRLLGIGDFTRFVDSRIRVIFSDRTLLEIDAERKKAKIVDRLGQEVEMGLPLPTMKEIEEKTRRKEWRGEEDGIATTDSYYCVAEVMRYGWYIHQGLEYARWSDLSPAEQESRQYQESYQQHAIERQIDQLETLLVIEGGMKEWESRSN